MPIRTEEDINSDVYIEASMRMSEGHEYCIPHTVLYIDKNRPPVIPIINLSDNNVTITDKNPIARGWLCTEEDQTQHRECVMKINT